MYLDRKIPETLTSLPVFEQTAIWLDAYFRGEDPQIDFPIKAAGSPFQELVWKRLLKIPLGQVVTYGQIAREAALQLGKEKMSAQAVGGAVGRNPVSIIIPCHRVVGSKGKLTGYTGGMDNKRWLLRHEGWTIESDKIKE